MNSRKQRSAEDKCKIVMEGIGKKVPLVEDRRFQKLISSIQT